MKKVALIVTFTAMLFIGKLSAQNLQLHYDFGKDRSYLTSTVEMFKPDKLGNTFFFVDMNYSNYNIDLAYWEIARVFKTAKMPVGLHVEYDGGLGQLGGFGVMQAYQITGSFLAGVDYSYNTEDFSKGFSVKALYKYIHEKHDLSFQLTAVWYMHFFNKKLSFTGFADFWREDWDFDFDGKTDTKFIFLTEPQIWYNLNEHFSFGGEVEISSNFAGMKGFHAMPTVAAKYNF